MNRFMQRCGKVFAILGLAAPAWGQAVIVDNTHPGFSVLSSSWDTFTATGQWHTDYRHTSTDDPAGLVEWRPELPAAGAYEVAVWYRSTGTGRPSNAHYTVHHAGGATDVYVNQQASGSVWVPLGTFSFAAGNSGSVTLASSAEAGKTIVADAVLFRGSAEWRAMWAYSWGSGFLNPAQTTNMINTLAAHNYNVVIPEIRKAGDAYYDSAYEPRATNMQSGYDALADIITKAHAAGIEVHAWIVTYRIWHTSFPDPPSGHPMDAHPEWLMADTAGNTLEGSNYYLDPGVPRVQEYVLNVVMDIVNKYDIDGMNLDYIRYQGAGWGYNAISQQRFADEFGSPPPLASGQPLWETWGQWRRDQVTDMVRKIYVHIQAVKPHVVLTGDSVTWGSLGTFVSSDAYRSVFQDWRGWMQAGIVDAMLPMNYKNELTHAAQYRDWGRFAIENKGQRHAYIGQGSYLNTIANSIIQIGDMRALGADGFSQYQYAETNSEGAASATFFAAMEAQHFPAPAPTPAMPWKLSPTTGILAGTVTDASLPGDPIYGDWIYKATVELTGPVSRSVQTDATGFYAFIDLPPGDYTVTVSKAGFDAEQRMNRQVSAGAVNFTNVALGEPAEPPPCEPVMLTDFEGYPPDAGINVMFRAPSYSGSTNTDLAASPNETQVTDDVPAFSGTNATRVSWQWIDTDAQRWLRLTTSNVADHGNPTIAFSRPVMFRMRLDSGSLRVCIGLRETGTAVDIGSDGGTTGTIEWVGAGSTVSGAPQGVLVTAQPGVWQTLVFDPQLDPILAMTGDGALASPTGRGTLEHIAFSVVDDAGPHTVYLDDIEQLCAPGDWDADGDLDLADFAHWTDCMTGPVAGPPTAPCRTFDLNHDAHVDTADFARLQRLP